MKRLRLEVTANFETNLDAAELHQPASLLTVLVRLEEVTRLLRRQPHVGRPWACEETIEEHRLITRIQKQLGGGPLRECVLGDFLMLYLVSPRVVHLLALRHHRQREYQFGG